MTAAKFNVYPISEGAITISFGDSIDEGTMDQIYSLRTLIEKKPFKGFYTSVPGYTTLTLFYDPVLFQSDLSLIGKTVIDKIYNYISSLIEEVKSSASLNKNVIQIPVKYGGEEGPDLLEVAKINGLTPEDVISIHSAATYKVCMIGFVPGFAYLSGLSKAINAPRKLTPRPLIPKGSVGIAGSQTGIYPLETPGGWQLIGRTTIELFDEKRQHPSLLKAGDIIKFIPVKK